MLVGQDIGLAEVVWISLFGMAVATIAIILLMIFVIIMSKIILQGKKVASERAKLAQASSVPTAGVTAPAATPDFQSMAPTSTIVTEDDIAGITAALCVETGMRPEQFRIVSITSR